MSSLSRALSEAHTFGAALLAEAKDELGETWDDLRQREAKELEAVARSLGKVLSDYARDRDEARLERELAHLKAQTANWTWIGADRVVQRWKVWLDGAAEEAGRVLKRVAKGLIS